MVNIMSNNSKIVEAAKTYLYERDIENVEPAEFGRTKTSKQEVIFMHPLAIGPGVVMDPPDVRVWVNIDTYEVEFIHQM